MFSFCGCGQNCVYIRAFVLENTNIAVFDGIRHFCCIFNELGTLMYQHHFFAVIFYNKARINFEATHYVLNSLVCPKCDIYAAAYRHYLLKRQKTSFFSRLSLALPLQNWQEFDMNRQ